MAWNYITCVNTTKLIALDQTITNHAAMEDSAVYLEVVQRRGVIMSDEMKLFVKRELVLDDGVKLENNDK
eukprot:8751520-Ditylum_brightwellii.AAC.1